ncbi:hypothetical protein C7999DRAFT_41741 [Corynascus novoguineensis]|uniref:Uncharacterized protein n=1 Tax=Corynascus novoguineensis TaxID=1126955 RepID=A0AAN7CRZ2_9PEZI|nr:hypothetical protein C7999DRAFT_41741 [Corynascus novoguineensis]
MEVHLARSLMINVSNAPRTASYAASSGPKVNKPSSVPNTRHISTSSGDLCHEDVGAGEITTSQMAPLPSTTSSQQTDPLASMSAITSQSLVHAEQETREATYPAAEPNTGVALEDIQGTDAEVELRRENLLGATDPARMMVFKVNSNRRVTMLKGALARTLASSYGNSGCENSAPGIGENVYDVLNRLRLTPREGQVAPFFETLESVLDCESLGATQTYEIVFTMPNSDEDVEGIRSEGVMGLIVHLRELDDQKTVQCQKPCNDCTVKGATGLERQNLIHALHELRTPAIGVASMANLLLSDKTLRNDQRMIAVKLHQSAEAVLGLINDKLSSSNPEPEKLDIDYSQFSVSGAIRAVLELLRPAAESKGLAFRTHIADDVASDFKVLGDPGRLRQVVANLLSNSIRSTSTGYVKFSAVAEHVAPGAAATLKFEVQDSSRFAEKLIMTGPYTRPNLTLVGGGLSISKAVVEAMKGRMTLDTSWGAGTTITVWIPFTEARQKLTLALIEQLGFGAAGVSSGSDVLSYVKSAMLGHRTKPGVILMNLTLPQPDGYQCANILRRQPQYREYAKGILIVGMAASTAPPEEGTEETELEARCKSAGMDECLFKPLTIGILRPLFERWTGRNRLSTEEEEK